MLKFNFFLHKTWKFKIYFLYLPRRSEKSKNSSYLTLKTLVRNIVCGSCILLMSVVSINAFADDVSITGDVNGDGYVNVSEQSECYRYCLYYQYRDG